MATIVCKATIYSPEYSIFSKELEIKRNEEGDIVIPEQSKKERLQFEMSDDLILPLLSTIREIESYSKENKEITTDHFKKILASNLNEFNYREEFLETLYKLLDTYSVCNDQKVRYMYYETY